MKARALRASVFRTRFHANPDRPQHRREAAATGIVKLAKQAKGDLNATKFTEWIQQAQAAKAPYN